MQKKTFLDSKGIDQEIIDQFGIIENGNKVIFPYRNTDGSKAFLRYRDTSNNTFWYQPKGNKALLYNLWNLKDFKNYVVICEGETDTLTLLQLGINAVGCPGVTVLKKEWIKLFDNIDEVYIFFDNDDAGKRGAVKLFDLFERDNIFVAQVPNMKGIKDINDLYVKAGYIKDNFQKLLKEARSDSGLIDYIKGQIGRRSKPIQTSGLVTDEYIVDMIYSRENNRAQFVVFDRTSREFSYKDKFSTKGMEYMPYNDEDLIKSNVVRIPENVRDHESTDKLIKDIKTFIDKYVDISSDLEKEILVTYILLTWVYDKFSAVPYLKAYGNFGSGKSRNCQ